MTHYCVNKLKAFGEAKTLRFQEIPCNDNLSQSCILRVDKLDMTADRKLKLKRNVSKTSKNNFYIVNIMFP